MGINLRVGLRPQDVLHLGEEAPSHLYYCQLDAGACYVFTEQLGRFALVGEALSVAASKRLKLLLFAPAACTSLDYAIRVYCLHDTHDALKVPARPPTFSPGEWAVAGGAEGSQLVPARPARRWYSWSGSWAAS